MSCPESILKYIGVVVVALAGRWIGGFNWSQFIGIVVILLAAAMTLLPARAETEGSDGFDQESGDV